MELLPVSFVITRFGLCFSPMFLYTDSGIFGVIAYLKRWFLSLLPLAKNKVYQRVFQFVPLKF